MDCSAAWDAKRIYDAREGVLRRCGVGVAGAARGRAGVVRLLCVWKEAMEIGVRGVDRCTRWTLRLGDADTDADADAGARRWSRRCVMCVRSASACGGLDVLRRRGERLGSMYEKGWPGLLDAGRGEEARSSDRSGSQRHGQ